jgi:hypothetical protein
MQDDLAAKDLDFRTERGAGANELPILSQEHGHGSIKAVVFSGPDPKGNRAALGVGELDPDASLLQKREQSRRAAVAHGCRSQAYTNESEFNGAAGLGSDEIFFANTADLVRRVKPVTRKAGYSSVTDVDMVVFGHDLEGGDKDGSSMLKESSFAGSAGASSAQIHTFLSSSRSAPKDVPQMRDQMDNIVFGHEMQDTPQQAKAEELFFELQKGSAGEASTEIGSRSFPSRLEKASAVGGPAYAWGTLGNRSNEPRGDLKGALPNDVTGPAYPPNYRGSIGAPRDMLARKDADANFTVNSAGGPVKPRFRHDLDSADARSVLEETYCPEKNTSYGTLKQSELLAPPEKVLGAAGKQSRMINDYNAGPFTWVDVDTEEERRLAEFNAGSQAVKDALDGGGYIERDTDPAAKLIPDEYAAIKGRKVDAKTAAYYKEMKFAVMGDSVSKQNLLQPDLNFAAIDTDGDGVIEADELEAAGGLQGYQFMDAKSELEMELQKKNFGNGPPFGSDPLDTWYGKPDYTTTSVNNIDKHLAATKNAYAMAKVRKPPESTPRGARRTNFQAAGQISEDYGTARQNKVHMGVHKSAPFGVDGDDFDSKYETSSSVGPGSWDQSMASRIARRRLTGKGKISPTATGGNTIGGNLVVQKPKYGQAL